MNNILFISKHPQGQSVLYKFLGHNHKNKIHTVKNTIEAINMLENSTFNIIIINYPIDEENIKDFSCKAIEKTTAGIIILVDKNQFNEVSDLVSQLGIIVVEKPISKNTLNLAINFSKCVNRRLAGLKDQNIKLIEKLNNMKTINLAKCILIEKEEMSEAKAHRYLEKQAMDKRITRLEVAKHILSNNK